METSHSIDLHCPACDNHGLVIDAFGWLHCSGCCSLSPEAFEVFAKQDKAAQINREIVENALRKAADFADMHGFTIDDIRSQLRTPHISNIRQILFHELHTRDGLSFSMIGKIFHKDHSSVSYAVKKVADALKRTDA